MQRKKSITKMQSHSDLLQNIQFFIYISYIIYAVIFRKTFIGSIKELN